MVVNNADINQTIAQAIYDQIIKFPFHGAIIGNKCSTISIDFIVTVAIIYSTPPIISVQGFDTVLLIISRKAGFIHSNRC